MKTNFNDDMVKAVFKAFQKNEVNYMDKPNKMAKSATLGVNDKHVKVTENLNLKKR